MYKIVKKSEGTLHKIAENKQAMNYITKNITSDFSLAVIKAENFDEMETATYNRIYYVLSGQLELTFDGVKNILKSGDTCYLQKGSKYQMSGTFGTIVINQPAFGV